MIKLMVLINNKQFYLFYFIINNKYFYYLKPILFHPMLSYVIINEFVAYHHITILF